MTNFQGFANESLTSSDLFQCKQQPKESLKQYYQRFVHLKAKAPNKPEEVTIKAAIKGLRIGPFVGHLARVNPSSIEDLYNVFEKYYRSDNDLRKRVEQQNQFKQHPQLQGNKQPPWDNKNCRLLVC